MHACVYQCVPEGARSAGHGGTRYEGATVQRPGRDECGDWWGRKGSYVKINTNQYIETGKGSGKEEEVKS